MHALSSEQSESDVHSGCVFGTEINRILMSQRVVILICELTFVTAYERIAD